MAKTTKDATLKDQAGGLFGGGIESSKMTNSSTEDRESLENSPQSVTLVVDAPETPEVEDEDVLMAKDLEAMEQFDVGTLEFEADVFARCVSGGPMVTIFVGPSPGKKYVLSKLLLCHRVKYFRRVFMGRFQEAQQGILRLEDMTVETFNLIVQWIYTNELHTPHAFGSKEKQQKNVSMLVHVAQWADRLAHNDGCELLEQAIKELDDLLDTDIDNLTSEAINAAFPSGSTSLKNLISEHCVILYLKSKQDKIPTMFPFHRSLSDNGDFASAVLDGVWEAMRRKQIFVGGQVMANGKVRLSTSKPHGYFRCNSMEF